MGKVKKRVDFTGQEIFVGLDVHWKQWTVCIATEHTQFRPFASSPDADAVTDYLKRSFPGGTYRCAYEAGFSGYIAQEVFSSLGVSCIVVHPADIPTTDRDSEFKRDASDALKICRALRSGLLQGIYIPSKTQQTHRSVVRQRNQLRIDINRQRNRIKGLLKFYGVRIPEDLDKPKWPTGLLEWLYNLELVDETGTETLQVYLGQLTYLTGNRDYTNRRLNVLSNSEAYIEQCDLLSSVPGVGRHTAIKFLIEIGDISRFRSLDQLCNYIGLVPASNSSGENIRQNRMTYRGNRELRTMLIESAWTAVGVDPALTKAFEQYKTKMMASKAIIRIARKLLARIRHVLLCREPYEKGIVK